MFLYYIYIYTWEEEEALGRPRWEDENIILKWTFKKWD